MFFLSSTVIFVFVHSLPWLLDGKGRSVFSPGKLSSLISLLTTLPYMVVLYFSPEKSPLFSYMGGGFEEGVFKFSIIYSLGYLFYIAGLYFKSSGILVRFFLRFRSDLSKKSILPVLSVLFLIGAGAWFLRVQHAGGLGFLLQNLAQRSSLLAGSGIYTLFMDAAIYFSIVVCVYSFKYGSSAKKKFGLILAFLVFASMLSVFGGRKNTLYLLVFALMTWSLCVSPIKRPLRLAIPLLIFVPVYFIGVLVLRSSGSDGEYAGGVSDFFQSVWEGVSDIFGNLSYVDTYVFVLHHFSVSPFWYGAGFFDIFLSMVPQFSSVGRPPIDEGVYVRSLLDGFSVFPPTAAENMYPSSWPPESFGAGYMNFGIVGILGYMFVRGVVVRSAFSAFRRSNADPILLYIYAFILLNFHLTNLRIVQTLLMLVGAAMIVLVCKWVKR